MKKKSNKESVYVDPEVMDLVCATAPTRLVVSFFLGGAMKCCEEEGPSVCSLIVVVDGVENDPDASRREGRLDGEACTVDTPCDDGCGDDI